VLALTSHYPVCCDLREMACFRGAPMVRRSGASGVGLPGHRRGLNEARKNAAGRIDGDMTSAGGSAATVLNADVTIRFAFSSSPVGASFD
jgi:hypothetical protein